MKAFLTFCYTITSLVCFAQTNNNTQMWVSLRNQKRDKLAKHHYYFADNLTETHFIGDEIEKFQLAITCNTASNTEKNDLGNLDEATSGNNVSTLAGSGFAGSTNAFGASAMFNFPSSLAADGNGNLYVADAGNNLIRKISSDGTVTTFAGNGTAGCTDGTGKAEFYHPTGVAVDAKGNIYVADKGNHKIRKVTPAGLVSTLAGSGVRADIDGNGLYACFDKPVSVAVDFSGNVYVADQCNHKIKKITASGEVSTLAGNGKPGSADGVGAIATFDNPAGVAVDATGNVFVADYGNNSIRKITPAGLVSTIAGSNTIGSADGPANTATFYFPIGIAVDGNSNVYIADQVNNKIRKISITGLVSTFAGNGSIGSLDDTGQKASFNNPSGVAVDEAGFVYVADYNNHKVRKIQPVKDITDKTDNDVSLNPINILNVVHPKQIRGKFSSLAYNNYKKISLENYYFKMIKI